MISKRKQYGIWLSLAIFSVIPFISSSPKVRADEYWDQKVSLFDTLPIYPKDIVFVGNSITDGGHFNELFEMDNVKNRGIRSDGITGVQKRITQVTKGHPRKIFLLIGINDIAGNHSVATLSKRYEELVDSIRSQSPESQLYLQSVMPVNNSFKRYKTLYGKEATIKSFNKEIEKIATRKGAVYIDLWPFLSDSNGRLKREYTNDGLHLKGAGYKAWVKGIEKYVKE
ncbi:MAG: GDSL family lipase [Muribaculaceae bacterium]|nr:GDSL family lipase [Muribaculaceae bacterium]